MQIVHGSLVSKKARMTEYSACYGKLKITLHVLHEKLYLYCIGSESPSLVVRRRAESNP